MFATAQPEKAHTGHGQQDGHDKFES
jgi:hypothetical protein